RPLGEADVAPVDGDLREALHAVQPQDDPLVFRIESVDLDSALIDGGRGGGRDARWVHREWIGLVRVRGGAVPVELPHVRHLDLVPVRMELLMEGRPYTGGTVEESELPGAGEGVEAEGAFAVHGNGRFGIGVAEEVRPRGQAPVARAGRVLPGVGLLHRNLRFSAGPASPAAPQRSLSRRPQWDRFQRVWTRFHPLVQPSSCRGGNGSASRDGSRTME